MCPRRFCFFSLFIIFFEMTFVVGTSRNAVSADDSHPASNTETCINCHEDLYFLHDTGKWYCLREAPMNCVGCHDGDATAFTKERAHTNRLAHPIINDNIQKCQQCHPEESLVRVQMFQELAGVSAVRIAPEYVPAVITKSVILPIKGKDQFPFHITWQHALIPLMMIVFALILTIKSHRRKE